MAEADSLGQFLPPVRQWFRETLGEPTTAQQQGWPVIASGQNALILAPTGSGKTLAAFLACLDQLWQQDPLPAGVQVLYISPLKALNNDIERNLQAPLAGIAACAEQMKAPLPRIEVAVRTGDTSSADRRRQIRRPPHILITTPESLHLLLTSRRREMLRSVKYCIVDEIHALCSNKRGVFLALVPLAVPAVARRGVLGTAAPTGRRPHVLRRPGDRLHLPLGSQAPSERRRSLSAAVGRVCRTRPLVPAPTNGRGTTVRRLDLASRTRLPLHAAIVSCKTRTHIPTQAPYSNATNATYRRKSMSPLAICVAPPKRQIRTRMIS
jgi:hypothetical protein